MPLKHTKFHNPNRNVAYNEPLGVGSEPVVIHFDRCHCKHYLFSETKKKKFDNNADCLTFAKLKLKFNLFSHLCYSHTWSFHTFFYRTKCAGRIFFSIRIYLNATESNRLTVPNDIGRCLRFTSLNFINSNQLLFSR